jgi:hypothetical protein
MTTRRRVVTFTLAELGCGLVFMLLILPSIPPEDWGAGWMEFLVFVNLSLSAAILAHAGCRRTFFLPTLVSVGVLLIFPPPFRHLSPTPFPFGWLAWPSLPWWVRNTVLSDAIGLALVLAPATLLALSGPRSRPKRLSAADWAALGIVATAIGVFAVAAPHSAGGSVIVGQQLRGYWTLPSVGLFGILLGTRRPWWPWVYIVFPFAGVWIPWVSDVVLGDPGDLVGDDLRTVQTGVIVLTFLRDVFPMIVVGLVGASWRPLATVLGGRSRVSPAKAVGEGELAR